MVPEVRVTFVDFHMHVMFISFDLPVLQKVDRNGPVCKFAQRFYLFVQS